MTSEATKGNEPTMLRVADAAKLADVSEDMVMRWITAGHLRVFVPPGHKIGDGQRGPKSVRILMDDWRAFIEAHTTVGMGTRVDEKPRTIARASSVPAEPKRRNRRRS
jgi:hypothetical protein